MAVRCRGRLTLYEARGKFQMSVVDVEPTGAGALALAFEQLKQKLGAEGLFDAGAQAAAAVPAAADRRGDVGAGRRHPRHRARRAPALPGADPAGGRRPVQGEGAALSIAAALRRLEAVADVDVIIVARGGGSLEDLWAFNEEPVARAIVACRVPVISAVGHETDFTIADFVADVRAADAVGGGRALAVPVLDELQDGAARCCATAAGARWPRPRAARATCWSGRAPASAIRAGCSTNAGSAWTNRSSAAGACSRAGSPRRAPSCARWRRAFTAPTPTAASPSSAARWRRCATGWRRRCGRRWCRRRHALEAACGKLEALSPLRVLERGYSLTRAPTAT